MIKTGGHLWVHASLKGLSLRWWWVMSNSLEHPIFGLLTLAGDNYLKGITLDWVLSPTFQLNFFWLQLVETRPLCAACRWLSSNWMGFEKCFRLEDFSRYFVRCRPGWIYVVSHTLHGMSAGLKLLVFQLGLSVMLNPCSEWWVNLLKKQVALTCTLHMRCFFKVPSIKNRFFLKQFLHWHVTIWPLQASTPQSNEILALTCVTSVQYLQ